MVMRMARMGKRGTISAKPPKANSQMVKRLRLRIRFSMSQIQASVSSPKQKRNPSIHL